MKIIFIGGPFRGDGSKEAQEDNIERARGYAQQFVEQRIPFYSPHLNLSQLTVKTNGDTSEYAILVQNEFFNRCDALAVLPGWEKSQGTLEEIEMAKDKGIRIFYLEKLDAIEQIKGFINDDNTI